MANEHNEHSEPPEVDENGNPRDVGAMRVWMMEELLDLQVRFMGLRERVEAGDEQAARDAVELLRAMQAAAIEAGLGEGSAKGTKA